MLEYKNEDANIISTTMKNYSNDLNTSSENRRYNSLNK
jgi:hypothetical protein